MCDHKFQCLIGLIAVVILVNETQGSVESNGPKGISSIGLVDADGQLLNGDGIAIGQVEPGRPGKLVSDGGPDNAQHANAAIVPAGVFLRNENAIANLNVETADGHAEFVAGVMISTATTAPVGQSPPTGVATEALLYGSADGDTGPNFDANSALSAQHLTNVAPVRSVNMSFGNELEGSHVVDGNSLLTLFVDWSATQHNVLYVVAGNEFFLGVPGGPIPTDNFNGMVIATSEKTVDGFYRKVADRNAYADVVGSNRTVTSLMAPGEAINVNGINNSSGLAEGTSFAAPHVTGTVALLQQYAEERIGTPGSGWNENARRHEVMKSVLMNSADKLEDAGDGLRLGMTRTAIDKSGNNWLSSEAYTGAMRDVLPLDDQMGAGHLNAKRAVQQFSAGEHEANAGAVPLVGWDYGLTDGQDEFNKYVLDSALPANQFVSLTLAWDRDVFFEVDDDADNEYDIGDTFLEFAEPIDLNLYLMPAGGTDVSEAVARSIATDTSVEHIFFPIVTPGMYEIWVGQDSGGFAQQLYALAWWMEAIVNPAASGDYSGNGTVGPEDYTIWKANFGSSFANADGNGDGIVDAADYTVWRDHLGQMVGSGSAGASPSPVPEPSGGVLLVMAALVGRCRVKMRT